MLRSIILNLAKVKYFFTLLMHNIFLVVLAVDETTLCKIVTDLHLKKLSYNDIREHVKLIYGLVLTKHHIKRIIIIAGEKAKQVNKELDAQIRTKVGVIEVDEVFQGQSHVILGAAEKLSQYLLDLKPSLNRTSNSLDSFLSPIAKKFCNIKVVITDLYKAYKSVILHVFKKARHLACHIHVQRVSFRIIDKLRIKLKKIRILLKKSQIALIKWKQIIDKLVQENKYLRAKLTQDRQTRKKLQVKKQQSISGKTKTIDRMLEVTKKRILRRSESLKSIKGQLEHARVKRNQLKQDIRRLLKSLEKIHQRYLQSCRLQKQFFDLLKNMSQKFSQHLEKFINRLQKSKYPYAAFLLKMIRTNPQIFSLRKPTDLAWNFQNSNTIERIFGILRPRLVAIRILPTLEGTSNYCELFKLYYNTMPRYTGINNNISPFEQLMGKCVDKPYLEYLFPTRRRTTLFVGQTKSDHLKMGFCVRSVPHPGAIICA